MIEALTERLSAVSGCPRLEAELLVAAVLQSSRDKIIARSLSLTEEQHTQLELWIARRLRHEPLAYILGTKEFGLCLCS